MGGGRGGTSTRNGRNNQYQWYTRGTPKKIPGQDSFWPKNPRAQPLRLNAALNDEQGQNSPRFAPMSSRGVNRSCPLFPHATEIGGKSA